MKKSGIMAIGLVMEGFSMKTIILATVMCMAAVSGYAKESKPNVLMIFVDDLHYGALGFTGSAIAEDGRYVIQVSNSGKGIVKAIAKKSGAEVHIDGNGFIAATFPGKGLEEVRGIMNNPHVTLVEEDARRLPLSVYNDDAGDPTLTQITPYAIKQSEADHLSLQPGQKVCVIDSGLDRTNSDFGWENDEDGDGEYDITGDNDSGTGNWDEHGGPH